MHSLKLNGNRQMLTFRTTTQYIPEWVKHNNWLYLWYASSLLHPWSHLEMSPSIHCIKQTIKYYHKQSHFFQEFSKGTYQTKALILRSSSGLRIQTPTTVHCVWTVQQLLFIYLAFSMPTITRVKLKYSNCLK